MGCIISMSSFKKVTRNAEPENTGNLDRPYAVAAGRGRGSFAREKVGSAGFEPAVFAV